MANIVYPFTFTAHTVARANEVNANFTAVATVVNGGLSNSNIASNAAIAWSKMATTTELTILRATDLRALSAGITGDTVPRVSLYSGGGIKFGAGVATAHDIQIKRDSATYLEIRDIADAADLGLKLADLVASSLVSSTRAAGNPGVSVFRTGDTVARVSVTTDGTVSFGAGGASAQDIIIKRNSSTQFALRNAADSGFVDLTMGALTLATALTQANGGLGFSSYTAGDIITVNDAGNLVKLAGGSDGQILTYDSTVDPNVKWSATGSGDVSGPVSSTDYAIALWNGAGGDTLRDGPAVGLTGQQLNSAGPGAVPVFKSAQTQFTTLYLVPTGGHRSGVGVGGFESSLTTDGVSFLPGSGTKVMDATGSYISVPGTSDPIVGMNPGPGGAASTFWTQQFRTIPGFRATFLFKTGDATSVGAGTEHWIGLTDQDIPSTGSAGDPNSGFLGFRYVNDGATDNTAFWRAVSCNGGAVTVTTTAVAVATGTRYEMMVDGTDSTSIKFYINGTLVATHATNLPDGTDELCPFITLIDIAPALNVQILLSKIVVDAKF